MAHAAAQCKQFLNTAPLIASIDKSDLTLCSWVAAILRRRIWAFDRTGRGNYAETVDVCGGLSGYRWMWQRQC
jgi:hypothetical protein